MQPESSTAEATPSLAGAAGSFRAADPLRAAARADAKRFATAHHFGPDPAHVGGMGSVLRVIAEHRIGAERIVLHSTWQPGAHLGNAARALRALARIPRAGREDVMHFHLSEDGSFVREGALVRAARLSGRLTAVTIHGASFLPFAQRRGRLAGSVLRAAHLITCLDPEVLAQVRALAPHATTELLPNPVRVDDDSPGAEQTEEILLFAGETSLRKGADVLCRAWREVIRIRPHARCVMVGPETSDFAVPDIERLERRASVDPPRMRALLRTARVVVLPSRAEGMPMVLTEAMAAGRPFVSTPVGGIPALAGDGGGILVPVEDHKALAGRLIELLADPTRAGEIGERGRRVCRATRSVEVIDARLRALYRQAAATSQHRGGG